MLVHVAIEQALVVDRFAVAAAIAGLLIENLLFFCGDRVHPLIQRIDK